jgi:hypothetical protein
MSAAAAVHNCAFRDDLDDMIPHGRWRTVPVIAPSESQARDFGAVCAALVESSPALRQYAEIRVSEILFRMPREDQHGHKWTAKTAIRAMPASAPSIRGLTAALVVNEEMAHHGDQGGPADERRIWDAIQPMQVAFGPKAKTLGISTPYGESGLFAELLTAIEAGLMPHARAVRKSIEEMIPDIDREWLQARRLELGDSAYSQEFEAALVGSGGVFFSDLASVELAEAPARPEDGRNWVAAFDPSFHADQFGVVMLAESVHEKGVIVTGLMEGIKPGEKQRSLERRRVHEDETLAKVAALIAPYEPRTIVSDQHQADAIRSHFGRQGALVKIVGLTAPVQTRAFVATRARLVDGSLRLWRYEPLLAELRRVRAGRSTESIVLPRHGDSHCDIASALALGVHELRGVNALPEGRPSGGKSLWADVHDEMPAPAATSMPRDRFGRPKSSGFSRNTRF